MNDGGQVYPKPAERLPSGEICDGSEWGMSMRQCYKLAALGCLRSHVLKLAWCMDEMGEHAKGQYDFGGIVAYCGQVADALIAEAQAECDRKNAEAAKKS